jgi:hypothetical protein
VSALGLSIAYCASQLASHQPPTTSTLAGYFSIVPPELRDPFASADYLSPQLKPKAHLHVFYCAIMHHAIRWIKAGFLEKTFKYEELVLDPHAVLAKLLALAGVPLHQSVDARLHVDAAMRKDSQKLGKVYTPKPAYSYTEQETADFTPCHARFGLFEFYQGKEKLEGCGSIVLPNRLLADAV